MRSLLIFIVTCFMTLTPAHAETIKFGNRIANVLTTRQIAEKIRSDNIKPGDYVVCKCQLNFRQLIFVGNATGGYYLLDLENAGQSGVFSILYNNLTIIVNKQDMEREIAAIKKQSCNIEFGKCHANILIQRIGNGKFDISNLLNWAQRTSYVASAPIFHFVIDYTGGSETIFGDALKEAVWFYKKTN